VLDVDDGTTEDDDEVTTVGQTGIFNFLILIANRVSKKEFAPVWQRQLSGGPPSKSTSESEPGEADSQVE
jgi:hypothetical protein